MKFSLKKKKNIETIVKSNFDRIIRKLLAY